MLVLKAQSSQSSNGCKRKDQLPLTPTKILPLLPTWFAVCVQTASSSWLMTSVDVCRSSAVEWKVMQGEVAAQSSVPIAAKLLQVKCSSISTWTLALGIRGLVTFSLKVITKQLFGTFVDTGCGTTLCAIQQTKFRQFGKKSPATTRIYI